MKNKIFVTVTGLGMIGILVAYVWMVVYVDPLFHYHAPTEGFVYPLFDERYMNDGISRHFEYDSIITGTSMTQNFQTSLWDELFGTTSIKIPASGARYKEINDMLERAYKYHDGEIKLVLRGLDLTMMISDKDAQEYDEYPEYLYDDNLWNDVHYVLNKDIFFDYLTYVLQYTAEGRVSTDFDHYKVWGSPYYYNVDELLEKYDRVEKTDEVIHLSEEEKKIIEDNLNQNVIVLIKNHPETQFYLFFPPYSILYWDDLNNKGNVQWNIEMQRYAIEMLLPLENVHLYSFFDDYLMMGDLRNYKDTIHYGLIYSNQIMENMKNEVGLLTPDNYEQYLEKLTFYDEFDYDSFLEME